MRSFTSWVRRNSVQFEPFDGARADIEKLAIFDDALERSRIVFLAEQNHFVHEKYDYRLWFLRYLFSRGFRHVGEELSWSDGIQIDRYLATGNPAALDRVATYGYRGAWRTDRNDEPTGYLRESWDNYPEEVFRAEQLQLARALRALSEVRTEGERLHFFGFDVDAVPGVAYEQIDECLALAAEDPAVAKLRRLLERVHGETIEQEIERLDAVLGWMREREDGLSGVVRFGGASFAALLRSALTLRESLDYMRVAHPAKTLEGLLPALAQREELMHAHVEHVVEGLAANEKLVLMAANDHLCKDVSGIRRHTSGAPVGGKAVPPIGTFVARRYPGQVFSIWFLYERGRDSQPFASLGNDLRSPARSMNRRLGKAGDAFVLATASTDPESAPLREEAQLVSLYNTTYRARLADQADAICFVRDVTPLRA